MDAESAYLFRHALVRDAAYELQPLGDRAALHALAFLLIEDHLGGRASLPAPADHPDPDPMPKHGTDPVAEELAEHARLADGDGKNHWLPLRSLYLHRAANVAEAGFRNDAAHRYWLALADLLEGTAAAGALRRAAAILYRAGRVAEALVEMRVALAAARGCSSDVLEGRILGNLASISFQLAQMEDAERLNQEALFILRRIGDRGGEALTLANLGVLYHGMGRTGEAEAAYERALKIQSDLGLHAAHARTLHSHGTLLETTGRSAEAERAFRQALDFHRATGDRRNECSTLGSLANLLVETGRREEGEGAYQQAITFAREVGDARMLGVLLGNLANQYYRSDEAAKALAMYDQALQLHRQTGNRRSEGIVLGNMAESLEQSGDLESALQAYRQALEIHRETKNPRVEHAHRCAYAICLLKAGQPAQARMQWQLSFPGLQESRDTVNITRMEDAMRLACAAAGVPQLDAR